MLDTLLAALVSLLLGILLTLWWADGRQEKLQAVHRTERTAWEVERLKLMQALVPGVSLTEVAPQKRRVWSDEEEAAWEAGRKPVG